MHEDDSFHFVDVRLKNKQTFYISPVTFQQAGSLDCKCRNDYIIVCCLVTHKSMATLTQVQLINIMLIYISQP